MTTEQIQEKLKGFRGWEYTDQQIQKTYSFVDSMKALEFVNQLAIIAEHENHHPTMTIAFSKVTIALSTHEEDNVTDKDFQLAKQTDQLAIQFI